MRSTPSPTRSGCCRSTPTGPRRAAAAWCAPSRSTGELRRSSASRRGRRRRSGVARTALASSASDRRSCACSKGRHQGGRCSPRSSTEEGSRSASACRRGHRRARQTAYVRPLLAAADEGRPAGVMVAGAARGSLLADGHRRGGGRGRAPGRGSAARVFARRPRGRGPRRPRGASLEHGLSVSSSPATAGFGRMLAAARRARLPQVRGYPSFFPARKRSGLRARSCSAAPVELGACRDAQQKVEFFWWNG